MQLHQEVTVTDRIEQNRLKWFGHVERMDSSFQHVQTILIWTVQGFRSKHYTQ